MDSNSDSSNDDTLKIYNGSDSSSSSQLERFVVTDSF